MTGVTLTIWSDPLQALRVFGENPRNALRLAMKYTALKVYETWKKEAPVDRGLLHARVDMTQTGEFDWKVTPGAGPDKYAAYVAFGTGRYAEGEGGSRAKKIPWVYYYTGGNGPKGFRLTYGQHANKFHERAMDAGRESVENNLTRAIREVDRLAG